ncbi:MAG: hypothetical protein GX972_05190 [Amphibacillus sp.]|nr:hypothetical protein [Amphibacillus sp.]
MTISKSALLGVLVGGVVSASVVLSIEPKSRQAISEQIINKSKEGLKLLNGVSIDLKDSLDSYKSKDHPYQRNINFSIHMHQNNYN